MSIAVELSGITKSFPGVIANDDINLVVKQGEIHAICGENGAGKSTLMKILYGMSLLAEAIWYRFPPLFSVFAVVRIPQR